MRRILTSVLKSRCRELGLDETRVLCCVAELPGMAGPTWHVRTRELRRARVVLERLAAGMADDALATLCFVAQRLELGQRNYALLNLETDNRDWARERDEELGDQLVYSACEALSGVVHDADLVQQSDEAAIALLKRRR